MNAQLKPGRWNVRPTVESRELWRGLIFMAPLWEHGGDNTYEAVSRANAPITAGTWEAGGIKFILTNPQKVHYNGLLGSPPIVTMHAVWLAVTSPTVMDILTIGDHVVLRHNANDSIRGFYYEDPTWLNTQPSSATVVLGTVNSATYTCDPGNADQQLYVNGVFHGETSHTDAIVYTGLGGDTFIGANAPNATGAKLDGIVLFAAAWDRVLQPAEVRLLAHDHYVMIRQPRHLLPVLVPGERPLPRIIQRSP